MSNTLSKLPQAERDLYLARHVSEQLVYWMATRHRDSLEELLEEVRQQVVGQDPNEDPDRWIRSFTFVTEVSERMQAADDLAIIPR